MSVVDLGFQVILLLFAAVLAGIILRRLVPVAAKIIGFCIVVYIIGGIAKIVTTIGIAKTFLGLVVIGYIGFLVLNGHHTHPQRSQQQENK